jgi:hypothetical protein
VLKGRQCISSIPSCGRPSSDHLQVDIYRHLGFETKMPKYKENVPENPEKLDFAEIIKGVHETIEFPMWVLLRRT